MVSTGGRTWGIRSKRPGRRLVNGLAINPSSAAADRQHVGGLWRHFDRGQRAHESRNSSLPDSLALRAEVALWLEQKWSIHGVSRRPVWTLILTKKQGNSIQSRSDVSRVRSRSEARTSRLECRFPSPTESAGIANGSAETGMMRRRGKRSKSRKPGWLSEGIQLL